MDPRQYRNSRFVLGLGLTTLAVIGCTRDRPQPAVTTEPARPATAAANPGEAHASAATPDQPAADEGISGTVVETMDAGGYTYAKLDRGSTQVWVAGPQTKLAVGAVIGKVGGTPMAGFRSDTLGRTFELIYFINSFSVAGGAPPNPHTGDPAKTGNPEPHASAAPIEKIEPAKGGRTIAQVFGEKLALVGKPIVVRGKVVKLNNGILGRNWLHIQDGTGAAGTSDLTITTAAMVALGDVVVVRGTLATDKDFGGGYKYDVLIENATVATK